jgi:hypothetical protein
MPRWAVKPDSVFSATGSGVRGFARKARAGAKEATRDADAAECLLWSEQMEGFGGPAQPSPTTDKLSTADMVGLRRCVGAARPAPASRLMQSAGRVIRRSGNWKLPAGVDRAGRRDTSGGTPRYKPPVHIKLSKEQGIAPYVWCHPNDER